MNVDLDSMKQDGLSVVSDAFDEIHKQLFTFALDVEHEIVNLRAVVQGKATLVNAEKVADGTEDAKEAIIAQQTVFMDGEDHVANIYDRAKLKCGNKITGPAIITEMDSTSVVLNEHIGLVDEFGNIVIRPIEQQA